TGALLWAVKIRRSGAPFFSRDGETVMLAGSPVRRFDTATGEELASLDVPAVAMATSPGEGLLAAGLHDGSVELWDMSARSRIATLLSTRNGWVSFTDDGHLKHGGDTGGMVWYAIGLARFEPGELDAHLPAPLVVPRDTPLPRPLSRAPVEPPPDLP